MSEDGWQESPSTSGFASVVDWAIQNSKTLLGALSLATYAVVRVAHDSFYRYLGTNPEGVGLDQVSILARAALSVAVVLAGLAAFFGITVLTVNALGTVLDRVVGKLAAYGMCLLTDSATPDGHNAQYLARVLRGLLVGIALAPVLVGAAVTEGTIGSFFISSGEPAHVRWAMLLLSLSSGAVLYLIRRITIRADERYLSTPWLLLFVTVALPTLLALLNPLAVGRILLHWPKHLAWTVVWLGLMTLLAFWGARKASKDRELRHGTGPLTLGEQIGLITVLGALFFPLFMLAEARGQQLARMVSYGEPVRPSRFGLLSVRAESECLLREVPLFLNAVPVLILGEDNSRLVVWQPAPESRLVQIPAEGVVRVEIGHSLRQAASLTEATEVCRALA